MLTIRKAAEGDFDALVGLWVDLIYFHESFERVRPSQWRVDPTARAASRLRESFANATTSLVLVAERDGDIVGMCTAEMVGADAPCPAVVHTLFVRDDRRGEGIGQHLLDTASEWCRGHGAEDVNLNVAAQNDRARRFYERNGFTEVEVMLVRRLR